MADEKKMTKDEVMKSQTNYTGSSLFELVEVTIVKDGDFYKKGDKDKVHPSLAEILKAKGLIDKIGTPETIKSDNA